MSARPGIEPLGESGLLLRLGETIDPDLNRRVHALAARLARDAPDWLLDLVPAYASLALVFDPERFEGETLPAAQVERWLRARLREEAHASGEDAPAETIEIPVCYGGEFGPDLEAVAKETGLTAEQVASRHRDGDYTVAMLGFAPGFPYLLGLDPALAVPRLDTPRTRVPAGSVGLGGAQTGIYPREGPGGWRLIGRTPLGLFDPNRDPPAKLLPGQRVRFVAIEADEFERLARARSPRRTSQAGAPPATADGSDVPATDEPGAGRSARR